MLKRYFGAVVLGASLQFAAAFSLWGPVGNGGDSWQISSIGYGNVPGCIRGGFAGAPKNLGEEYRWNIPTLTYAYDQNFLDYFGSNGVVAMDNVFLMLSNHISARPLTSWSSNLTEFPLNTSRINFRAQALGIVDFRAVTLNFMVEQLGLADPTEWVWTLRNRQLFAPLTCPDYTYEVIQRNYDPVNFGYSKYINGTLFTYTIRQGNCVTCDNAIASEELVDPLPPDARAVASGGGSAAGAYYTGLTRDDMGGLRYLMATNNMNVEGIDPLSTLISGGFTNRTLIVTNSTLDLRLFALRAATNTAAELQGFYPALQIGSSVSYFTNAVSTNVEITTLTTKEGAAQVITNTGVTFPVSTLDLATLLAASVTNTAAELVTLFPGLVVTSEGTNWVVATNYVLTPELYYSPYSIPGSLPLVRYSVVTNYSFAPNYVHTFGNVITNSIYTNSIVRFVTTGLAQPWAVAGSLNPTNVTVSSPITTNLISGDFYLLPTNLCGFTILQTLPLNPPVARTNLLIDVFAPTNGVSGSSNGVSVTRSIITYFTNHTFLVQPVTCLGNVTNYTTNVVTRFNHTFDNVVTNHFYTNTPVQLRVTNVYTCNPLLTGILCTNTTATNVILTNVVSGDFLIIDTNQCGLSIVRTLLTNVIATTNLVSITTNGTAGVAYQSEVNYFTNYIVGLNPVDCQATGYPENVVPRRGINQMFFQRRDYDSLIGQYFRPVTNTYQLTAVYNSENVPQTYRRVVARPDILFTARDFGGLGVGAAVTASRTPANFDTSQVLPGLAGPGLRTAPITFTYNKVGQIWLNQGADFVTELDARVSTVWGFFDSTTNAPIVFPNNRSVADLETQVLMQITTAALPDAAVGLPYGVNFTGSGGTPAYTWTVSGNLPLGMTLTSSGLLSGTPAAGSAGVYDLTVVLTDAGGRTVVRDFTLTVY